jgi:Glyoxalase-like domain
MAVQVQISIDCADPEGLARFWADVLGYQLEEPPSGYDSWSDFSRAVAEPGQEWHAVVDSDGVGPRVLFHRVPEAKVVKNRLHLDVRAAGARGTPKEQRRPLVDAEANRLLSVGATLVRTADEDDDYFAVMQDPEGNEFCVC